MVAKIQREIPSKITHVLPYLAKFLMVEVRKLTLTLTLTLLETLTLSETPPLYAYYGEIS